MKPETNPHAWSAAAVTLAAAALAAATASACACAAASSAWAATPFFSFSKAAFRLASASFAALASFAFTAGSSVDDGVALMSPLGLIGAPAAVAAAGVAPAGVFFALIAAAFSLAAANFAFRAAAASSEAVDGVVAAAGVAALAGGCSGAALGFGASLRPPPKKSPMDDASSPAAPSVESLTDAAGSAAGGCVDFGAGAAGLLSSTGLSLFSLPPKKPPIPEPKSPNPAVAAPKSPADESLLSAAADAAISADSRDADLDRLMEREAEGARVSEPERSFDAFAPALPLGEVGDRMPALPELAAALAVALAPPRPRDTLPEADTLSLEEDAILAREPGRGDDGLGEVAMEFGEFDRLALPGALVPARGEVLPEIEVALPPLRGDGPADRARDPPVVPSRKAGPLLLLTRPRERDEEAEDAFRAGDTSFLLVVSSSSSSSTLPVSREAGGLAAATAAAAALAAL